MCIGVFSVWSFVIELRILCKVYDCSDETPTEPPGGDTEMPDDKGDNNDPGQMEEEEEETLPVSAQRERERDLDILQ